MRMTREERNRILWSFVGAFTGAGLWHLYTGTSLVDLSPPFIGFVIGILLYAGIKALRDSNRVNRPTDESRAK